MHSPDLIESTTIQMMNWIKRNCRIAGDLTAPKELASMSDDAREKRQRKEKIDIAQKIVNSNLHNNSEFTGMASMLTDLSDKAEAYKVCFQVVGDIVGRIQVSHYSDYHHRNNASDGKLVAV